MRSAYFLLLLVALATADQLIPIQKSGYGFTVGDSTGKLHIEAFFDFQCKNFVIKAAIQRTLIQFLGK